jgi:hypothetical protein
MLEAVVPTGAERGDNRFPDSPPVRAEAVLHLLRLIAGTSGLLVVLEDLHWSDPDTLAVGGYLADNLPAEPVLCVATAAGLTPDNVEDVPTPYVYPDLDTAVRAQLSSGPAQRAIEYAGEQRSREAMIQAFGGCRRDDGSYRRTTRYTT